jgi:hypothetical protein
MTGMNSNHDDPTDQAHNLDRPEDSEALRTQRQMDYLQGTLANSDPLTAMLGAMNSDLVQLSQELHRAIHRDLPDGGATIDDLARLYPAINLALRLDRQVERLSQFALRSEAQRKRSLPGAAG